MFCIKFFMKQFAPESQNPFGAAETFWKRCLMFFIPAFCLGAAGFGFMILPDTGESERRFSAPAGKNYARTKASAFSGETLSIVVIT